MFRPFGCEIKVRKQVDEISLLHSVNADCYIIVMPNMDRSRRSSEGEEEVKGPERSLVEWREEKRRLEEKLEEKRRKTRLDSLMSFSIDGGSILEVQRYDILYTNAD